MMRDALSDFTANPLPDWAWLRASLPSSLGGLNLHRAMFHATAAVFGAFCQSISLVFRGTPYPSSTHCISAIAEAGLPSRILMSHFVNVLSPGLLMSILATPSWILLQTFDLALSPMLFPRAGDWLNVIPTSALGLNYLDCESFDHVCITGLVLRIFEGVRCLICQVNADSR